MNVTASMPLAEQPPGHEVLSSSAGSKTATEFLTPGRFLLVLTALLFALYPEVFLGTHSFFDRDFGLFTYPVAQYTRASFWRGEIPLWNPLNNCGVPFLAQWNTCVCYPPAWICLVAPLPWSLNYLCLAHLLIAGLGMWLLARRWLEPADRMPAGTTLRGLAPAVAGLAYALNGLTFNCLMWLSNLGAIAWLPFTVLYVERAWREGGCWILVATVFATLQMLSGAPEIILLTWVMLGTLWLRELVAAWRSRSKEGKLRIPNQASLLVFRFLAVLVFVCGLSAVQLLPFFQLVQHSNRDAGYGNGAWSMPGWGLANFIVPLFRCAPTILGPYIQVNQQWTSSYYMGISVLALAALAVWKLRTPKVRWLALVALAGVLLALGENGPIYKPLKLLFPHLGFVRYPIKFIIPTVFALPLLAAFGIQTLVSQRDSDRTQASSARRLFSHSFIRISLILTALLIIILLVSRFSPYSDESWSTTWRNGIERALLLAVTGVLVVTLGRITSLQKQRWLGFALLVVLGLDALTHVPRQNPTVTAHAYDPMNWEIAPLPNLGESRAMVSPRMQALLTRASTTNAFIYYARNRRSLFEDCNLAENIPKVNGFFSSYIHEQAAIESLLYRTNAPGRLIDFLGVSQMSSPDVFWQWDARRSALPLITAGQKAVFADAPETLKALAAPDFGPKQVVYLAPESQGNVTATNTDAKIPSSHFSAHQITAEVSANDPAMVVIAQTFYPAWRAYVDGQPATLHRANHAFQAVQVPSGRHSVRLIYRDSFFYAGAGITGLTVVWLTFLGVRPKFIARFA